MTPPPKTSGLRGIARLARFLFGYVRPYWRLLLATIAVTAVNAVANQARAALGGSFLQRVVIHEPPAKDPNHHTAWERLLHWLSSHAPAIHDWLVSAQARFVALLPADDNVWGWVQVMAGALIAISLVMAVSEWAKDLLQQSLVLRTVTAIRERVMAHILSLSMRFFHRQQQGDLYSRLNNDISQAQQAIGFLFGDIFEHVSRLFAGVALCFYISWRLSLYAALAAPIVILPLTLLGKRVRKGARKRQVVAGEVSEAMHQMLSGVRIVKAFHAEEKENARFHERNEAFIARALRVISVKALSRGVQEFLNHLIIAILLLAGAYMATSGTISWDDMITFVLSLGLMYEPAKGLVKAYNQMQESLAGLDRVEEILDEKDDVPDAPGARPLGGVAGVSPAGGKIAGTVRLRGVSFAYKAEPVLIDLDIEAKAGEVVAIVGPSGAGKSTLVDLLLRFYDPDSGAVEIDGQDIRAVTRESLLSEMAIVTQEAFLFNGSVLENVRYGRREATLDDVQAACRAANIHDAIAALPAGYDSVVGERGATLSGGQRQRLTIARALLKNPKILLLDEATSALDSASEKLVQEALDRLMKGRTTIVVAHRLSTIIHADRIVVIGGQDPWEGRDVKGRKIEEGTHAELLAKGGFYKHELWDKQHARPPAAAAPAAGADAEGTR